MLVEMEVLRLENIERRVQDQNMLLTALKLRREASLGLREAKRVLHNEHLPLSSGSEQDLLPLLYRTAMSLSSDSSSEYTTDSSRATSLTTVSSITSSSSSKSLLCRLQKAYKRLSYPAKRRTMYGPKTSLSLPNRSLESINAGSDSRPPSAHSIAFPVTPPFAPLETVSLSPPLTCDFALYSLARSSCAFESYSTTSWEDGDGPEVAAARERSRLNSCLQSAREKALEEQSHFLQEYHTKYRTLLRERGTCRKKMVLSHVDEEALLTASHAAVLSKLESKHLTAEQELEKDLATEQRNLDVRIKHMSGYCSGHGSSSPEGTLKRKVTSSDRRSLAGQQVVRNGINDLHKAKINVLRAKQAKQIERMTEKQKRELENLRAGHENALTDDGESFRKREEDLKQEVATKKQKMSRKWTYEEAFTRWRLEEETQHAHGPLPAIEWSEDEEELESWNGVSVFDEDDDADEMIEFSLDAPEPRVSEMTL